MFHIGKLYVRHRKKDILFIGLLLSGFMLCKPKKTLYQVETIRDVHSYVVDGVNCDTVSDLVYIAHTARITAAAVARTTQ